VNGTVRSENSVCVCVSVRVRVCVCVCKDLEVGRGSGIINQRALEQLQVVRGDGGGSPLHAQLVVHLGLGKTKQKQRLFMWRYTRRSTLRTHCLYQPGVRQLVTSQVGVIVST